MWKEDEMREFQDPYCYKGTNVLINNLGIRNEKNLSTYERAHVASKLLALNIRPNNGDFSLKHYCSWMMIYQNFRCLYKRLF